MRRHFSLICSVLLGSTALSALTACVAPDGQGTIVIVGATPQTGEECVVQPQATVFTPFGVVDLSFQGRDVLQGVVVEHRAEPDLEQQNIQTNEVRLSTQVSTLSVVSEGGEGLSPIEFSVPMSSVSVGPGSSQGAFLTVPASILAELRGDLETAFPSGSTVDLMLESRFDGLRLGTGSGNVIEGRSFTFPIQACFGCLRSCFSTIYTETDENDVEVETELCTAANCASDSFATGGECGAAYNRPASPLCCSGDPTGLTPALCGL